VRRIGAGAYHAFVQTNENQILAFGKNGKGQLGVGHANHVSSIAPEEVKGGLSGQTIKHVYHSSHLACCTCLNQ
jgi:alpha-tubulin suppressor-like RCC1 family protein